MKNKHIPFSVCMAVYINDEPSYLMTAVHSIYNEQSIKPSEIIIVIDGPIKHSMQSALTALQEEISIIRLVHFETNHGHAAARQAGLESATNNLVAIMDADDISESKRFELQLDAFEKHPEYAVIGGQITEFIEYPTNIVSKRTVPFSDKEIKSFIKSRCPMNLITVMYRKDLIQEVGGFMDWYCEEDYYLWIRLAEAGCMFANLPDYLANVRVGKDMYQRRGGWRYFKSEARLQGYMLKRGIISLPRYFFNIVGRFVIQIAMPNKIRGFIFQKMFRK